MSKFLNFWKRIEPKEGTIAHTAYDAFFTLFYAPDHTTKGGTHIKDNMDLKRTMIMVVLALTGCYIFGTYNIGHQHFKALGLYEGLFAGFHLKLFYGLGKILPLIIVSNLVGLGIEFFYAYKRNHSVEEGYLVTGALIPLIMPPDLPLWILVVAIVFAVVIGKEAFGGTGMNIWNVALLARVFIFFAYPTSISGDAVWVAGLENTIAGSAVDYSWYETGLLNSLFEWFGWAQFDPTHTVVDGYTGATPLGLAFQGGWEAVTNVYSESQIFWGTIPGSIGETCKPLIILGALMLLFTGIGSKRIMISGLFGAIVMGLIYNAWGATPFMEVPWYYQLYMGSFFFAIVFMATDPVTATATNTGKIIYGFLIGMIGMVIRVMNPAYPEGWMLAILFLNMCAPLIDHYVVQGNINKRLKRA